LTESNVPEFLQPRLRLFLSADIVGSTAYKQALLSPGSDPAQRIKWVSKIQGFYFEATKAFLARCAEVCEGAAELAAFGEAPQLWKTIGDEVLFTKVLTHHSQVAIVLDCWLYALERMREYLKKGGAPLDVKATAWIAGFPLRNSEVAVSTASDPIEAEDGDWFVEGGKLLNGIYNGTSSPGVSKDYIGPSIDIGFRLTTLSSSRRLIVSVDVAYILSLSNPGRLENSPVYRIYYQGAAVLKGVFGGVNYPVFWIDMSPAQSLDRLEDELTGLAQLSRDKLRRYCLRFYQEYSGYTFPPFIDDGSEQLIPKPDWYDADLEGLIKNAKLMAFSDESQAADNADAALPERSPTDPTEFTRRAELLKARLIRSQLDAGWKRTSYAAPPEEAED